MIGRRKPYTERGIRRVLCARCRERPAVHQWNACAISNRNVPVCDRCDVALNAMVLRWLRVPAAEFKRLMARYRKRVLST